MRAVWIMALQGSKVREEWREWGLSVHLMIEDAPEVTHQSSYSTIFRFRLPLCLPSISLCFHYDYPLWICCSFLFCLSVATLPFSQPFIRPRKQEQTLLKFFCSIAAQRGYFQKVRPLFQKTCGGRACVGAWWGLSNDEKWTLQNLDLQMQAHVASLQVWNLLIIDLNHGMR